MSGEKLLYHYCRSQTGFSILQTRTLRLSALSSANDSLEGRVLGRVFSQLLATSKLLPEVVDVASIIVEGYADATEGFAFCLSERGDLLSQWRAYGGDGSGISVGFSSEMLIGDYGKVSFGAQFAELIRVEYGEEKLRETLKPLADKLAAEFEQYGPFVRLGTGFTRDQALRLLADRGAGTPKGLFLGVAEHTPDRVSQMMDLLAPLHFQIYSTKPDSFHEECEWRLLRYRHKEALPDVEYFADDDSIRPYISCLIADPAKDAIREVVLGPKHRSNVDWVRAFLSSVGLPHVLVKRSAIESYR